MGQNIAWEEGGGSWSSGHCRVQSLNSVSMGSGEKFFSILAPTMARVDFPQ